MISLKLEVVLDAVARVFGQILDHDEDMMEHVAALIADGSDENVSDTALSVSDFLVESGFLSLGDEDAHRVHPDVASLLAELYPQTNKPHQDSVDSAAPTVSELTTPVKLTSSASGSTSGTSSTSDSDQEGQSPDAGVMSKKERRRLKKLQKKKSKAGSASQRKTKLGAASKRGAERDEHGFLIDTFDEMVESREAVAQVSRYHWETVSSEFIEVDLKNVSISIGDRDLLVNSDLRCLPGHRYGLVGRNGVGKSTLLKHIARGTLIGFPTNVRTMLVEQEIVGSDDSCLHAVLAAHTYRSALLSEESDLMASMQDPEGVSHVVALRILKDRAKDREREARLIAAKRSGSRGVSARSQFKKMQKAYLTALAEYDAAVANPSSVPQDDLLAESLLGEITEKLVEIDSDSAEGRASAILTGLQFTERMIHQPTRELSGGWRMRVALAQALFMEPDLLLLDEPTNHLDINAIIWLQEFLKGYEEMIIIVSHDRVFLDEVSTETMVFRNHVLTTHPGNYSSYIKAKADLDTKMATLAANEAKRKAQIQKSIEYNAAAARKTGDDKRLAQNKSRKKKMARMGMEKLDNGKRFRMSKHGYYRKAITVDTPDAPISLDFPSPGELGTMVDLIQLDDVTVGYERELGPILENVTLTIEHGSRITILGNNGCGKSTLLKTIMGQLTPWSGTVHLAHGARVAMYAQHHMDALDHSVSAVQWLHSKYPGCSEQEYRQQLGRFDLSGDTPLLPISSLSGGQKARLVLATITWDAPHVLILDEPSNNLDHDTLNALIDALKDYTGAVILVSHDQHLISAFDGIPYLAVEGTLSRYEPGFAAYVAECLRNVRTQ